MKVVLSERALTALEDVTPATRKAFYKQVALLEGNLLHPSLRAKKYDEALDLWQARVKKEQSIPVQLICWDCTSRLGLISGGTTCAGFRSRPSPKSRSKKSWVSLGRGIRV